MIAQCFLKKPFRFCKASKGERFTPLGGMYIHYGAHACSEHNFFSTYSMPNTVKMAWSCPPTTQYSVFSVVGLRVFCVTNT